MNKVYKVIWSKVKHCYVVASEFAKTNGKSPSKALVGAVLMSLLSMSAFASGVDNGIVTSQDGYAGGTVPIVTGNGSIAIGTHAVASGNNMTWEQLKTMMDEYNIKKEDHDDLSTTVAGDVSDVNNAQQDYNAASTAAVAVQAAREAQAGYQSDLDNYNQQKPAIDDAYDTTKNEYETMLADFQSRIERVKFIDFSIYADGSPGGYDYDRMATNLKTDTETGTSFNMPVQFYKDYILNYVKANGDLRINSVRLDNFSYVPYASTYAKPVLKDYLNDIQPVWSQPNMVYSFTNIGVKTFDQVQNSNVVNGYYSTPGGSVGTIKNFINSFDSTIDLSSVNFYGITKMTDFDTVNPPGTLTSSGYFGILTDPSTSKKLLASLVNSTAYSESQKDTALAKVQFIYNNHLSSMTTITDSMVSVGVMTSEEASNFISVYNSALLNDVDILNAAIMTAYYQKLYEDTGDLSYIGNKEQQLLLIDNKLKSFNGYLANSNGIGGENKNFEGLTNGIYNYIDNYMNENNVAIWNPWQIATRHIYENVTAVQDATVMALRQVINGLEGIIADKKQAYDDATAAKEANDNAITNLQNQIASLEPTPEQQALADELDQKAQDLQNAQDKLAADEAALQQAYQDMLDAQVGEIGEGAIAIGYNTITTGKNAIGMGTDAVVTAEEAIALGKGTVVSGQNSIGIGSDNSISQPNAIAIGTNNGITGANSIAIGNNNVISGANSIAIGNGLNISEDNVVALGGKKVSGVTNGTVATDAATVGQTYELVAGDGMSIVEDGTNAIGQKKFKLNSTATGGTTYTSGSNIVIEDDVISAEGLLRYDGEDKKTASLEGTGGTKLTNLKQASLTRTSTDAVIGAQLWQTNSNVAGMQTDITTNANNISALTSGLTSVNNAVAANSVTIDTLDDLKADKSLTNLTDVGRQVISAAAANAVQEYMAANSNGGATGNGLLGGINTLSAPRPMGFGLMASPSTNNNIVTNNDLLGDSNDISMEVQAALDEKANISLDNINEDGVAVIRGALADDLALKADKEALETLEGQVVTNTGQIASLDGRISSAENALDQVVTVDLPEIRTSLDSKADKDSVYTKEETDTKLADKADIAYVDEGLAKKADKASVYSKSEVDTKLLDKANTDATNIDVDAWSKKLATGEVLPGDTGLVNGDTVFNSVMAVAQSNPVQAGENAIFIGKQPQYDGIGTIDVSNSKGEARVMTGVITNPEDMTSVANVGYVNAVGQNIMGGINQRFSQVENKISDVGANAAAMSALMPVGDDADKKWSLSASVGHYDNSTASAVGLFYKPSDNVIVNVRGTVGSDENMLAGGVSVALDKGSVPGVSKAQLVRTVNAQAERLNAQDAQIAEMREEMARMAKRIEAQEKRK